ncbi:MAG TPA: hypothetical protein VFQ05_01095 [Candidatus Eisenbacteria bacterium]|jgi:hypothetical protein|nr:hypothetical protein [Candidatus Eisenbacteria bacterium]HXW05530.1 hypothetical protein [Vicinamibacterales bacterium]
MHRYMVAVGRLTTRDWEVRLRLLSAFHMIAGPESLFAPSMLWRVVAASGRRLSRSRADCSVYDRSFHTWAVDDLRRHRL